MKKCFIFLVIPLFLLPGNAYPLDVKGLQPVEPYGVFSTFSAESMPKGNIALSAGVEISGNPDYLQSIVKTAVGVSDSLEFLLTVPYNFDSDAGKGFEDGSVGIKHRFFDEGKYGPSLAYVLRASLPWGAEGLTTDGRYGIGLVVSKKVGPVNGHLYLSYDKPGAKSLDDEISFLTGLDFAAAHNLKFLAELICKMNEDSGSMNVTELKLGYRVKTSDFIYTTFGMGFDLRNKRREPSIMFSVAILSQREKKSILKIYEEE